MNPIAQRNTIVGKTVYDAKTQASPKDNATAFTLLTHSPLFFFHSIIGFSGRCPPYVVNLNASAFEVLVEFF